MCGLTVTSRGNPTEGMVTASTSIAKLELETVLATPFS